MIKLHRMVPVAIALAVFSLAVAGLVGFIPTEAVAATLHPTAKSLMVLDVLRDHVPHFATTLAVLRASHDDLVKRAADKLAELKDDTPRDQARTINEEHGKLLTEIEAVRTQIAAAEQDEAQRNTSPTASGDAARAADILDIGTRSGMDTAVIQEAIRSNTPLDTFRARAFDFMAERVNQSRTAPGRVIRDEVETRREAIGIAMSFRMGGIAELSADQSSMARGHMDNHDVVDFAAVYIGHRGAVRTIRDREEVLTRAFHTTSDFPNIFSSSINSVLERRYALALPTYRRIANRSDFMDFRPHYSIKIGEFPMLEKLTESGEIEFGTFGEGKEQIAVVPYAKGVRVTRQMLVNDRLGAIGEILGGYGRTVSRFEEMTFYAMMASANTKLSDGKVVFHADHANLAGAGGAISVATIGAGKAAMRKQTSLDGAKLNLQPSILLVSPDKETEALQYLAPISANDSVKVNPHVGTLEPIVSAELTGNEWYLFADPAEAPVYQWGLLDGYTAPRVRIDEPFGTQGLAMTVEHDFGVGAVNYRGAYKNPGA